MEEEAETSSGTSQIVIARRNKPTINGRLPPDSLLHIWARLPIISLYKFRSVCHLWNSLISSDPLLPSLRHTLHHHSDPAPTLLLILRHLPDEPIKVPDRPAHISTRPIHHILSSDHDPITYSIKNGFTPYVDSSLHLLPSHGPVVCFASNRFFYLCNPSTQQFLRLSPPTSTAHGAFGFFRLENRYILVSFPALIEFGPGQAESAQWRAIKPEPPAPVRGFGLMVNGLFFWAVDRGPGFAVCLDHKTEEFRLIPAPEGNPGEAMLYDQMYLVEFKGAACAVDNFSRPPRMEIWVLNENEMREFYWVRKYNIYITGMSRDVVYPFWDYEGGNNGGEEIVLCNETRSRLYSCNVKNRSIKQVYKPKNRSSERLSLYTPGLFPLTMNG